MTKREFLDELHKALEGNIPGAEIEENIRYYDAYFRDSGRTEQEVCAELGDPRLIARTLIDSFTASKGPMADYYREQARNDYSRESRNGQGAQETMHGSGEEKWYDKLFRYIMMISIAVIVGAVLIFALKITVTVVLPILLVLIVIKLLLDFFRGY